MRSQSKTTSNKNKSNTSAKASASKNSGQNSNQKKRTSKTSGSKPQKTLDDLFEEGLKDIYSAEKQLLEALPEMAEAVQDEELRDVIEMHLEETEKQVERLEKIMERMEMDKSEEKTCEAMKGLIEEAQSIIKEFDESPVRDSALIIAAQKVEHYEIASYGSLRELADVLGYYRIAELLDRTLEEEEEADKILSSIAMDINDEACEISGSKEEEEEEEKEVEYA
jgi:ferritin-like metal-binding protein YciE